MVNSTAQKEQSSVQQSAELKNTGKICGRCQEIKPVSKDYFYANKPAPDGLYSTCIICIKTKSKRLLGFTRCRKCFLLKDNSLFESNRTSCRKCRSLSCYKNRDKVKSNARHLKWRTKNKEKHNEYGRAWKAQNKERHANYNKKWASDNPAKVRAKDHRRRSAKLNATPIWFDKEKADLVYVEAVRLETETGVKHEVDHIIPLQGKTVCGLHVHYNLQAIPTSKNRSKGNRLND